MIRDLIARTRSYRRFDEEYEISHQSLIDLIELARQAGSARNMQPLKYMAVTDKMLCEKIFSCLGWAGYLSDWPGPVKGERPTAYIICLLDTDICSEADVDLGIASQNILLGAAEKNLGGCRIASLSPQLKNILQLAPHLVIKLVIALGKPVEKVKLVDAQKNEIKYWRDEHMTHYVPKRKLDDILLIPPLD